MPSDGDSPPAYRALGREGWIGLHWPQRLGGRGLSPAATLAAEERFGYHWLPLSGYLLSVKTIGNALLACAGDELAERFLPPIAAGELVFCQGFSEPEAGSDLAALRSTARRDGERFVVSGHKIWTSSAQIADWIYLAVRTDPQAERPHRGISVLLADMRSPGIEIRAIPTLGGGALYEVFLDEVEVPASQLVGELHGGWAVLMRTLDHERVTSEKVGVVLRVLDDLAAAADAPAERRELRRLRGEAEAARLHGRRAVELLETGHPAAAAASMAKLSIATLVRRTAELGIAPARPRGPGRGRPGRLRRRPPGRPEPRVCRQHDRGRRRRDPAPRDRPHGSGDSGVSVAGADLRAEAAGFAETVAAAVRRHPTADPWTPGAAADDRVPALETALGEAGLGRARGRPRPARARGAGGGRAGSRAGRARARGRAAGRSAVPRRAGPLRAARRRRWCARAPGGSSAAAPSRCARSPTPTRSGWRRSRRAEPLEPIEGEAAQARLDAWVAGSVGYMAGLGEAGLALAVEHTRARIAFGRPLAELEPVQQLLADAATLVEGVRLLCAQPPSADALAHAGEALVRASAACQQVTGALGFTLEFPLQRVYRRARALQLLERRRAGRLGARVSAARLPLDGLRVLDYGQYVAAPLATMLLADLGADVVKVEPPDGDQWRRYDPFADGQSRYFHALNRGKRSVALDLRSPAGRERSAELIASADALVHNCLPERARRFGLDRHSVHARNPRCVVVAVSAFGSAGPDAERPAYDLIAQALSGLLLAQPRPGDAVPRRLGGLALADFTAGLLAALSVVAGLLAREERAPELEVSLLGAALTLQAQRFVSVEERDAANGPARAVGPEELAGLAAAGEARERLDPYYRAHACRDGLVALACLNATQRRAVCALFGLEDSCAANPQAEPADEAERSLRLAHAEALERGFAAMERERGPRAARPPAACPPARCAAWTSSSATSR